MSNLSINGDGNILPIKDTGVNAGENVASSSTPQMNSVWGEFLENGDNTVDAGDVQLRENATDLQKRAVRDFLGVHKGREWTEKLVNIVKNLLTNPAAIEEVSNNGVYTRAIIKDEKGNDYQISYDNINYSELGEQVNADTITYNDDGTITKTTYNLRGRRNPGVYINTYDKDGALLSAKSEQSLTTANYDNETGKITYTQDGKDLCYSTKNSEGKRIYYLPNGEEIGNKDAVWEYASKNDRLNLTSVFMLPLI